MKCDSNLTPITLWSSKSSTEVGKLGDCLASSPCVFTIRHCVGYRTSLSLSFLNLLYRNVWRMKRNEIMCAQPRAQCAQPSNHVYLLLLIHQERLLPVVGS